MYKCSNTIPYRIIWSIIRSQFKNPQFERNQYKTIFITVRIPDAFYVFSFWLVFRATLNKIVIINMKANCWKNKLIIFFLIPITYEFFVNQSCNQFTWTIAFFKHIFISCTFLSSDRERNFFYINIDTGK